MLCSRFADLCIENDLLQISDPLLPTRILVPESMVDRVLEFAHAGPDAAHLGYKRLRDKVSRLYFWPSLRFDTRIYVSACPVCDSFRNAPSKSHDPLGSIPVGEKNQIVTLDHVG